MSGYPAAWPLITHEWHWPAGLLVKASQGNGSIQKVDSSMSKDKEFVTVITKAMVEIQLTFKEELIGVGKSAVNPAHIHHAFRQEHREAKPPKVRRRVTSCCWKQNLLRGFP